MPSNGGIGCTSKTAATIDAYLTRGRRLWNRAAVARNIALDCLNPQEYIVWLESILWKLRPASRRQYVASTRTFLAFIKVNHTKCGGYPSDLDGAIIKSNKMQSCDYTPEIKANQWRGNTSSQKAKKVSINDLIYLAKKTKNIRGKWIQPALLWMSANINVGLRPIEWRDTKLIETDQKIILCVVNAKNTNGRSHGKFRHLDLTDLDATAIKWIKLQLQAIKKFVKDEASWQEYYSGIRHTIKRLTRKYLPCRRTYPSLYSTRHQFAANAKTVMEKVEVAALMGHAVEKTASMHYGKKKHAQGDFKVKADPDEVRKVRTKILPVNK